MRYSITVSFSTSHNAIRSMGRCSSAATIVLPTPRSFLNSLLLVHPLLPPSQKSRSSLPSSWYVSKAFSMLYAITVKGVCASMLKVDDSNRKVPSKQRRNITQKECLSSKKPILIYKNLYLPIKSIIIKINVPQANSFPIRNQQPMAPTALSLPASH